MSTLSPELQHDQWLSVSNIYTRTKKDFEPGIPTMAYKTPLPKYVQKQLPEETFQEQFPSKGGKIPCENYYTAGAEPAQWCEPWGGECPLGRRVVPSRRADPVMVRGTVPVTDRTSNRTGNRAATYSNYTNIFIIVGLLLLLVYLIKQ